MLLNIKCVFLFSVQTLSEKFIVRGIERGIVINEYVYVYSRKTSVIRVRFLLNWIFSKDFEK
jgi:hypothetical protein